MRSERTFRGQRPAVLLAAVLGAVLTGAGCQGDGGQLGERPSSATVATAPGGAVSTGSGSPPAFPVGTRSFTFVDDSRSTRGGNGAPAASRTLPTTVWYPAATAGRDAAAEGGPFPVVVFSHGLGGSPESYRGLVTRWAEAGFVVVVPTYPLTSSGAGWDTIGDVRNQPADAAFALTGVLRRAERPGDPLHGVLDAGRVVAAGHSLGGTTTLGLFNRCCRDERLAGGIVLAGSAREFGTRPLAGAAVPLLFVHADDDGIVSYRSGRATYDDVAWPKAFVALSGAGHITPYFGGGQRAAEVVNDVTLDFLRWVLESDAGALESLRQHADVAGVARLDDALSGS